MKRAWRWPFAGFVVGALVGATILTVNVVGASSPERPPAGVGSFGEILHTPVLLARAGEPVELKYDVVCGVSQEEPGGRCSPKGSVFVRPGGRVDVRRDPARPRRQRDAHRHGACGRGADRLRLLRRDRQRARSDGAASRGSGCGAASRLAASELDHGRTRRRALRRDAGSGLGRGELRVGEGRACARARQRPRAVAHRAVGVRRRPDGSIVVLDQVNRQLVVMRGGGK